MSSPDAVSKQYLAKKVNPILEQMVIELVTKKPEKVCDFMIEWLKKNSQKFDNVQTADYKVDSEEEDEEEEGEELLDPKILIEKKQGTQMRTSVSAEVYGKYNQKKNFKPKVVAKSLNQIDRIKLRLNQAFMFQALDENEKKIVIDAMEEKNFKAGEWVIKQGDDGNELYVVDKGQLDCFKRFKKDGPEQFLKTYVEGDSFGELALLYNAPRAASIKAKTEVTLFSLDRQTFNHIVKDAAAKKRDKYEKFLSLVDILHDMEPYERLQVADALKSQKFQKGQYIVKEGESGETFFILEEGEAIATKVLQQGKEAQQVYQYKPGEYFGEIALLKNSSRAASVIATTDCTVVSLDRNSFKRLLGPLEDILRRNFQKYEKYVG